MNYLQNNDANNLHFAEFFFIFLFVSHSIYPILVESLFSSSPFDSANPLKQID